MAGTSGAPALLGPPLYGQWYVDRDSLPPADQPPHWFRDLNLDPRHRIAAGIGTMVIRKEQEPLMASAWDQLEQQRRDRQRLKRAQLAEAVGDSLSKKHFRGARPGGTAATHGARAAGVDGHRHVPHDAADCRQQTVVRPSGRDRRLSPPDPR
jgi:hypothetical protein